MRCPSCAKFVPYDTEVEPEEDSPPECDGTTFTAAYRRVLTCGECDEELKEATIEVEHDFESDIAEPSGGGHEHCMGTITTGSSKSRCSGPDKCECDCEDCKAAKHVHEFEVEHCDASPTTDVQRTDRRGRKIKLARYMKTLYGVECDVEVKCECGATATFMVDNNEAASCFEELT